MVISLNLKANLSLFSKNIILIFKRMNFKSSLYILIAFLFFTQIVSTQNIIIEGSVVDEFDYEVPFAAVGILKKNIGTTSTMEGTFSFLVTKNELNDVL